MSNGAIRFSDNDEYFTPKRIVDMFGAFDYDPATNERKAKEFGVKYFDTEETDGLKTDWTKFKRIWCNPPFTMKKEFLTKCQEFYDNTKGDVYILLPISFLTTKTFHSVCRGGQVFLPDGRIKFENGRGDSKSPAFGSVVVKIQDDWGLKTINI